MTTTTELPEALRDATENQPSARAALAAALASPVHAYLFAGPPGAGKGRAARAFAAELLADGALDPDDARRRALADPSPHPDLVWLAPRGAAQHLVDEVRQRVITAAAYRPFEGARRVFVIEGADAMADESQNALLKTLEEPHGFVHIILISAEPELLLETVRSRCQEVRFRPLDADTVAGELASRGLGEDDAERIAAARLASGDPRRAEFLVSEEGRELRSVAAECIAAALSGDLTSAPWRRMLTAAESAGTRAGEETVERLASAAAEAGQDEGRAGRRAAREAEEAGRRASRRARVEALDAGLGLLAAWLRDLAAVADGAEDLVLNVDRLDEPREAPEAVDARAARRGGELVMDTRRRLTVNVGEELALETLVYRLHALLSSSRSRG